MKVIGEGQVLYAFYGALGAVEDLAKTETADTGKYTYRFVPLDAVLDEIKRAIRLYSMEVTQEPTERAGMFAIVTTLIHQDGSMLEFEPITLPMPKEAQALGSAITYLKRYGLLSNFGVATEDDDGKAATVAAQAAPGRRTEAERMIRESIAQMDAQTRTAFVDDFKKEFGVGLSDLPAIRHGDALTWSRQWAHEPEDALT